MLAQKLIVFVKAPRPGLVKTRLAKSLGREGACEAYRKMAATLLGNLAGLPHLELRFTPDDAAAEIQPWRRAGWTSAPQGRGDLGERLARAFAESFAAGAQRVAIIGADCPEVDGYDIHAAWGELRNYDFVVGPATDGGYWLIALRQAQPSLFAGVHWGTDMVLGETLQRAKSAGLRIQLLRLLTDIDTVEDWRVFSGR